MILVKITRGYYTWMAKHVCYQIISLGLWSLCIWGNLYIPNSCYALISFYTVYNPDIVVNLGLYDTEVFLHLGITTQSKDKMNGTYKPGWLDKSSELGLKCYYMWSFHFKTNTWRGTYVTPYIHYAFPGHVYVDGLIASLVHYPCSFFNQRDHAWHVWHVWYTVQ